MAQQSRRAATPPARCAQCPPHGRAGPAVRRQGRTAVLAPNLDTRFAGSIPELYERYLVPLIF
ncbi:MAG TPA: hypothetical protein PK510_03725 [Ottowia sp.]|nr:hypothetical protein [Ottowia sp.]